MDAKQLTRLRADLAAFLDELMDKKKARFNGGRMLALRYLAKIAATKKHLKHIEALTIDLADLPGKQQAEVRQLLQQIREQKE
jgi:hypothetical protein